MTFCSSDSPTGTASRGVPGDVLHGDEDLAFHLAHFEDLAHMLVIHPGLGARLHHEPLEVGVVLDADELDGHLAAELAVPRQEDHPHAALPEEAQEFVAVPRLDGELRIRPDLGRARSAGEGLRLG